MKDYELTYHQFGEAAILIQWPQEIKEDILLDIMAFKTIILKNSFEKVLDVVNAYASLTIFYKEKIQDQNIIEELKKLYKLRSSESIESNVWQIPVCYGSDFGKDLESVAKALKLSVEDLVEMHSKQRYLVYFIGFLPGFLYLGGLDERLHLARKKVPDPRIPAGSVGIGGEQTGIYPLQSPGGWHILGNTPIQMFSVSNNPPCMIQAGDKIEFKPISKDQHVEIRESILARKFNMETLKNG